MVDLSFFYRKTDELFYISKGEKCKTILFLTRLKRDIKQRTLKFHLTKSAFLNKIVHRFCSELGTNKKIRRTIKSCIFFFFSFIFP